MVGDDERGAIVFDHRLGMVTAEFGADGVDEIGEPADDDRFGAGDSGGVGHCEHLRVSSGE